jgi:hypothetical protein
MAIRVPDGLDQVATLSTVTPCRLWRSTRRQVPLDAVAFATGEDLTARLYNRPPEDPLFDDRFACFCLGPTRRPLAAGVWGGFNRGCSHGD